MKYSAKTSYNEASVPDTYEQVRYSGILGRYRYNREQSAIRWIIARLPPGVRVLDCPCGTGRWWPALAERASEILAMDVSDKMLRYALDHGPNCGVPMRVIKGDAEAISLPDNCVDYVFSHALTKHLPIPVQYKVLSEFARVARSGVICSFGIFSHITYEFWRRRHLQESYPVLLEELIWMAEAAGLAITEKRKCTTPIGVEHTVLFKHKV